MFMILAQTSDISGVPADFVKNFIIMFAFVTVGAGAFLFGRRGSKGHPFHVEQPLNVQADVKESPIFAHQSALDKLRADMEARTRENLRQHEEAARSLNAIIEAGNQRQMTILNAISEMEQRMTRSMLGELKDIHERLNPLAEQTASNKATIESLQGRLQNLWEMIQTLWGQVFRKPAPRS